MMFIGWAVMVAAIIWMNEINSRKIAALEQEIHTLKLRVQEISKTA